MNYNAGRALRRCVASLLDEGVAEVRVVDNASTDGSIEILEAAFPGHPSLRVTRNTTNVGYSKAVNAAADRVGEGRLLVINPDAHLCPGALTRLETALDQAPGVALAAPLVRDAGGTPEPAAFRPFPDAWRSFVHFTGLSRLAGDGGALEGVRPAVVVGRDVGGPGERVDVVALADLDPAMVDMRTLLIVGSSATQVSHDGAGPPVVFTPRRYPG